MALYTYYVDESYDAERFCLTALGIKHRRWKDCFEIIHQHRQFLRDNYGIYIRQEIHATEFVGGRGRPSKRIISKYERSRIFRGLLNLVARLPDVQLFNVCLNISGRTDPQLDAWDRLLNRMERTLLHFEEKEIPCRKKLLSEIKDHPENKIEQLAKRLMAYAPRGMIFGDEGRERDITKAFRKMNVYNPIPSRYGQWADGATSRNIPVKRVIEDPVFKNSRDSYFVQLADCVAFALLKKETIPTPNIKKYRIHTFFEECLSGACYKKAAATDPLGIVRK